MIKSFSYYAKLGVSLGRKTTAVLIRTGIRAGLHTFKEFTDE